MSLINAWSGRLAPDGVQVKAKTDSPEDASLSLAVDDDFTFTSRVIFGPVNPTLEGIATLDATGLPSDTGHFWRVMDDTGGLIVPGSAGDWASTPDDPSLDITGDITVMVDADAPWGSVAAESTLLAKYSSVSPHVDQRAWRFSIQPSGQLFFRWSADGAFVAGTFTSSNSLPVSSGRMAVRVDLDTSTGDGRMWTAPTSDGPWALLQSFTGSGATSIHNSTASVEAGARAQGSVAPLDGKIHSAKVSSGLVDDPNQTLVVDVNFAFPLTGETSFSDSTGNIWTINGTAAIDGSLQGKFTTLPGVGQPASFSFAAAGDAGSLPDFPGVTGTLFPNNMSNSQTFDTIREHDPRFFIHLGDICYYNFGDLSGQEPDDYRRAYDDILLQPRQHQLYRDVPVAYTWDDHDFGANNSTGSFSGKDNAAQVYRERVAHYDLPNLSGAIYFQFQVGRCLFIVLDTRFFKDDQDGPDGPTKTMIGIEQKNWLEDILQTSDASFIFLISSVQWITGSVGGESWGSYGFERDEIGFMFEENGWTGRVIFLSADAHSLALDSGVSNQWPPGAPAYVLAAIDASPSALSGPYDIGISNAREQYGIITVTDQGDSITIRTDGYQAGDVLFTHSITVLAEPPPPPPPEPGPPISALPTGISSPIVEFQSFDLVSGELIADLRDVKGSFSRLLSAHTSASFSLPIPLTGPASLGDIAFQATVPGRTMLVAIINQQPAWGGRIIGRKGGTAGTLELATSTLEAYLARRTVQDHDFQDVDEAAIMKDLFEDAGPRQISGLGTVGGIGLEIEAPAAGVLNNATYKASDRGSVYDAVRERSAADGGLEWTIELAWANEEHTRIRKVIRAAPRIGNEASNPTAIFEITAISVFETLGGNEARYEYDEDYSDGRGATWVEAYSTGEGEDQPTSDPAIATELIENGWPIDEHHFQLSNTVSDKAILNKYAQRDLSLRKNGARVWSISARWNVFPQLNIDWRMGDDVGWDLVGHRHPKGVTSQGRCIGWEVDPQSGMVTPILLDPLSEGI